MLKLLYLYSSIHYYLRNRRFCNRYPKMSDSEIKDFQYGQLKDIINFAWQNVPYYKKFWKKHNFSPEIFNSLEDIFKIPIIDRNDIIENLDQFIPIKYNKKRLSLATTGGTTGMPMKFFIDNYIARAKEISFLNHIYKKYFNCKVYSKTAIFRGLRIDKAKLSNNIFWEYSFSQRGLVFSSFHLTKSNLESYLKKLRKYNPSFIRAYPSSIVGLCILMKNANEKPLTNLKGVICSSENVYDWQRDLVRSVLKVEIYSLYGHSEKCVLAYQNLDNDMEFHPLYGFTEFLNGFGKNALQSEMAEVIVTGFDHKYFPLIRYRTNDLIEVGKSSKKSVRIATKILGREQDFVIDKNNNKIQFTNHDEPFWNINGVIAYQYIQNENGKLTLNIQTDKSYDKRQDALILDEIKKIFVDFDVSLNHTDYIERTNSGKFKYLLQFLDIRPC